MHKKTLRVTRNKMIAQFAVIVIITYLITGCAGTKPDPVIKPSPKKNVTIIEGYVLDQNQDPIPECRVYTEPPVTEAKTDTTGKYTLISPDFQNIDYTIFAEHDPSEGSPKLVKNSTTVVVKRNTIHHLDYAIYLQPIKKLDFGNVRGWKVTEDANSFTDLSMEFIEWFDYYVPESYSGQKSVIVWLKTNPSVTETDSSLEIERVTLDITTENVILEGWFGIDTLHIEKGEYGEYSIALKGVIEELQGEVPIILKMKPEHEKLIEKASVIYHKKKMWKPPFDPGPPPPH